MIYMASMSERMQKKGTNAYRTSRAKREEEIKEVEKAMDQKQPPDVATDAEVVQPLEQKKIKKQATTKSLGRPASDKTAQMTIVMDPDLKQRFKVYCTVTQQTAADVIDSLIRKRLSSWERAQQ